MPPRLALLLCCCFVIWLFWRDVKLRKLGSATLWIPAIWLAILGSRPIAYWLGLFGFQSGAASNVEGNPLNLAVFLGLIVCAVIVLARRRFDWLSFVRENKMLILVYLYLAFSATWAEHGFTTFKRVVKDFGCVPVALVFLTDKNPLAAIRTVYVRVAYLLFPFSLLVIKYFPEIGHLPSRGGDHIFCGVTQHKNTLGLMLFVFGIILVFDWAKIRAVAREAKLDQWIRIGMLVLCVWLLLICESRTSLVCFVLGCLLFWGTGVLQRLRNPRRIVMTVLVAIVGLALIEKTFNVSGAVFALLGRDATLTGRVEIWEMVKEDAGSLLGYGFYSYWETAGAQEISALYQGSLNTTHNGFLEMYLDGGVMGLGLLIVLLLVWSRRAISRLLTQTMFGRISAMFWLLALIYNNSETSFFRLEPLWFTLLLVMVQPAKHPQLVSSRAREDQAVVEVAYQAAT